MVYIDQSEQTTVPLTFDPLALERRSNGAMADQAYRERQTTRSIIYDENTGKTSFKSQKSMLI